MTKMLQEEEGVIGPKSTMDQNLLSIIFGLDDPTYKPIKYSLSSLQNQGL